MITEYMIYVPLSCGRIKSVLPEVAVGTQLSTQLRFVRRLRKVDIVCCLSTNLEGVELDSPRRAPPAWVEPPLFEDLNPADAGAGKLVSVFMEIRV
jgi:hypothetical protein